LFKQLCFAGVRLVTLSEGEIGELHVGLKGTMNALFLKDLAHKTRRGLEGRIRQGKSGGGLCFGYDVVRKVDASGEALHGERHINEVEAAIVRRIFQEFAQGQSPRAIAQSLNKEDVPGPAGGSWGPSTIYGNWQRGTGILNNELYIGRLVWNRQQFIKDPNTGRRQARLNPESKWVIEEVPHLRIIEDSLDIGQGATAGVAIPGHDQGQRHPLRACPPTQLPPLRPSQVWSLRWGILQDQSIPLRLLHRAQQGNV
jgi:site-specific DNA recombinase